MNAPNRRPWWALLLVATVVAAPVVASQSRAALTLSDALTLARQESPDAAAERARVTAARSARDAAGRLPNPLVEFRSENWGPDPGLPLDTFATLTQTIELGGKRGARRGVADAGLGSAEARESLARAHRSVEISQLYLTALRHRERQRVLAEQASDLMSLVRVVGARAAVGAAPESDLFKMQTEEARAGADLVRAELAASRALLHLTSRLGVDATLDALAWPPAPPLPDGAAEAALSRRPDLVAAARVVDAARQVLRTERARGVPDAAITTGVKRTGGMNTGVLAVTLAVPLFDRNRAARLLAEGQVAAAEFERDALTRRARGELVATRQAAAALAVRAGSARAALVTPARAARAAARAAFDAGALDVMRLLDAERVATDAALTTIDLDIDAIAAAIDARVAAGEDPLP